MEIVIIAVIAVAVGFVIYYNRGKGLDVNKDGKVDAADAKAAVKNAVEGVKAKADVNKDGKVNAADAKVVKEKVKAAVKKPAAKAKTARKPKAK